MMQNSLNNFQVKGAIVALITPMFENGEVDYGVLEKLINWHISSGTKAIVSVGTTGESATLNNNEHLQTIKKTIEFANNKIPVIAGTGANSTREALFLTNEAKKLGANATLLVTPYYNKPTQEGLYQHYKFIADRVDIPQILYNVPGRTAVDMLPETIERLSHIKNIIGIKDATGDLKIAKKLITLCKDNFLIYSGDDATAIDFINMGGDGGISVSSNICPKEIAKIYAMADNDYDNAIKINNKIKALHSNLFIESNPIPVKWALHAMNKCKNGIRLPLLPLSSKAQQKLNIVLKNIGVL